MTENIYSFLPEVIKKRFPIRANSFESFVDIVLNRNGTLVQAKAVKAIKHPVKSASVGNIGDFEYSTEYTSRLPNGDYVVFKEVHYTSFGSDQGFADQPNREKLALQNLITAQARLSEIGEIIPNIRTIGPADSMDNMTRQKLFSDAQNHNIKPFPHQRPVVEPSKTNTVS